MAQRVELLRVTVACYLNVVSCPTQLSANGPGKTAEDPSVWASSIHMGEADVAPGSWLWLGLALALVAM